MIFLSTEIIWVITIATFFTLTTMFLACVCCQKTPHKDDLLGLDGMVKITNPDENVNHMPTSANYVSVNVPLTATCIAYDPRVDNILKSSRPSGGSNSNRSLPDIPTSAEPGIEVTVDASSDIYATVEDKLAAQPLTQNYPDGDFGQRNLIANCADGARPSLSQQSSLSQADAPYARLKSEHAYDKLKKAEHPYASVQKTEPNTSNAAGSIQFENRTSNDVLLTIPHSPIAQKSSTVSLAAGDGPVAPPRSRRASSHCSLPATSASDIPAATAVAGRVAASQDLPYMTPPPLQQNFSGDSQDSSKGYTSISVREPLANIMAQSQTTGGRITRRQELIDPHYATVSDDSDEMYAAIEEPNQQVYTSGSETYAQIQPTAGPSMEAQIPPTVLGFPGTDKIDSEAKSPAPQPPSVDSLRQVAQVHSRQASSSSCTSSVANLGSPKPEKRQANSPLPPRPPISPEPRPSSSATSRNLEDMYAKVQKNSKKKREYDDFDRRLSEVDILNNHSRRSSVQSTSFDFVSARKLSSQADVLSRKSWSSRESVDHPHRELAECDSQSTADSDSDATNDSQIDTRMSKSKKEHCYETLNKTEKHSSMTKINYDTNLSQRQLPPLLMPSIYDQSSGPDSILSNDPGYEVLHKTIKRLSSDCDPNYEVLKPTNGSVDKPNYSSSNHNTTSVPNSLYANQLSRPLYSTVNKKRTADPGYESVTIPDRISDEPNYESMPSDCNDEPNYASVAAKFGSSETDSNYETVHHDPSYESVKYYKNTEPPYERLQEDDSNNANIPGYECVGSNRAKSVSTNTVGTSEEFVEENINNRNSSNISGFQQEHSKKRTSQQTPPEIKPGRQGSGIIEEAVYKV